MFAYTYKNAHPLSDFQIEKTEQPTPQVRANDVLVRVKAVAFNPVDYKIRQSRSSQNDQAMILGWDTSGVIEQVGANVTEFKPGEAVYYAGDITRAGGYAELQAVDQRLIAHKPQSLGFAESAALPLTALTAYEALFERGFNLNENSKVLIIGGAGGVGSIAIQLLKALTPASVIATASRPETISWVKERGADHVIGRELKVGLNQLGIKEVDIVFGTTHTESYLSTLPEIIRPFGHLILIDDPQTLDIVSFKLKAISVHWEFMFAKSMHNYKPEEQGLFLGYLAKWVDQGKIKVAQNQTVAASVEGIKEAHQLLESGKSIGKIIMTY